MRPNFPKYNKDSAEVYDLREVGFKAFVAVAHIHIANAMPPLPPHNHENLFEISIFHEGMQLIVVDDEEYITTGGDVLVISPGETHSTGNKPRTTGSVHWLTFEELTGNNNFFKLSVVENRALRKRLNNLPRRFFKINHEMRSSLDMLMNICKDPATPLWKTEVRNLILRFILALIHQSENGSNRVTISEPISRVMQYIQDNLCDLTPQMPELAAIIGLSDSRFKTRFLKEVGITPVSYINTLKMEKAKALLCEPGNSISDVAIGLGFGSSQYFATVFKRITNSTPTQWINDNVKFRVAFSHDETELL